MATTILTGKSGTVSWASDATADVGVTAWTLEVSVALVDITSIDDAGTLPVYRNFTPGRKDWTATVDTVDAKFDPSKIGIGEAALTLGDGVSGSNFAFAKALCTNVSYSSTQDDVVRTTFTFVASGLN